MHALFNRTSEHTKVALLCSDQHGPQNGPPGVSATMCATRPKFASSLPATRSPMRFVLQK
jgi:hypothetical protein